jgi:hypothetical protein
MFSAMLINSLPIIGLNNFDRLSVLHIMGIKCSVAYCHILSIHACKAAWDSNKYNAPLSFYDLKD